MSEARKDSEFVLGFVTVVESPDHGFLGGLLLLNQHGRPLEFHCTAPIKPSRAHEILYGPTLRPYLFGERLAQALVEKAGTQPAVLLTDLAEVLTVAPAKGTLLARVVARTESNVSEDRFGGSPQSAQEETAAEDWELNGASESELQHVRERLLACVAIDPWEPFERIREALAEAQKAVRMAPGQGKMNEAA